MTTHTLTAALALVALIAGGCASSSSAADKPIQSRDPATLAEGPKTNPALTGLNFLAGNWVTATPRGLIVEELWTLPRGDAMAGIFRQVNADGKPAIVEVMSLTVDGAEVNLRMRHYHGRLEVRADETDAQVFRLDPASVQAGPIPSATFLPVSGARGVKSTTYARPSKDRLTLKVEFDANATGETPGSRPPQGYTVEYRRVTP